MNCTTSSRDRVTTARPVRQLVCFQPMPLSCSCRQTTFGETFAVPSGPVVMLSKYLITPRQSQPKDRLLAQFPAPPSPKSNACFLGNGPRGSAYGTVISLMLRRYMTLLPAKWTSWIVAPSRGLESSQQERNTNNLRCYLLEAHSEPPILPLYKLSIH